MARPRSQWTPVKGTVAWDFSSEMIQSGPLINNFHKNISNFGFEFAKVLKLEAYVY
jgi:hypothetical protein